MKTIFAQSSRPGKAGVAIFRISGPLSISALSSLVKDQTPMLPRTIHYKKLYDPSSNELIDQAMIACFKSPHSFTGEDVAEIYTHGSIAITKILLAALSNIPGLRLAEPGEFTRRAFLNGKFDLTSAEGIADLIEAETIWQHRQAIKQTGGELKKLYDQWRRQLLTAISLLEAYLDFPDEDIPPEILNQVLIIIEQLKGTITDHLHDNRRGELLREGIKMVILGAPNVGKSSLLNLLMQRDVSIVSDIAGTTRDVVEAHLDIGGYPVIIQDTAGIRSKSQNLIEQEGIRRARQSAQLADIKILMFDATKLDYDRLQSFIDAKTILVINKIDLENISQLPFLTDSAQPIIYLSVKTAAGLKPLLKAIEETASNIVGQLEVPAITRIRHRRQLEQALQCLLACRLTEDLVLATEDIRMAIRALSGITGQITVDQIIGEIFSNFCIGK